MDIKEELLKEHSKAQAEYIAGYIGSDPKRFSELITHFTGPTYRVSQRAAMTLSKCIDNDPGLLTPYLKTLVTNLQGDVHVAVKRNTLRVLQDVELPKPLWGITADICFKTLESNQEPIAVKVFAMTVLNNIVKKEPDLKNELRIIIEDQLPYGSAGFKSRARKIMKQL